MKTSPVFPVDLQASVLSVPPLARNSDLSLNLEENRKLARHLESAGVTTCMYGGNANFYNIGNADYADTLEHLIATASERTWIIPSIGPDYGKAVDQAAIAARYDFPTVMVLPLPFPATEAGVASGLARIADVLGKPVIVYVKFEGYVSPVDLAALARDGAICAVKYAIVRDTPGEDPYLEKLCAALGTERVISGIGERPVITHFSRFGLRAFTSGSVCVAPHLSNAIREALAEGDPVRAEGIRERFLPLEDLRDAISPIRVLHSAVTLAGIADMGAMLPMLSTISDATQVQAIAATAGQLRREDAEHERKSGARASRAPEGAVPIGSGTRSHDAPLEP